MITWSIDNSYGMIGGWSDFEPETRRGLARQFNEFGPMSDRSILRTEIPNLYSSEARQISTAWASLVFSPALVCS